ncbi:outer membrane beta-barrel family protein [Hymenobacter latericus]|uniref:outer membrane beta-barrel family protein n=1 Tax=Hymenobacter sp. YIM 151858-1 TaxID=2987688 RepID=UPI002226BC97|nr:outer membrane beta-barrel family protein [Hymenobacter sp. YIM 151858-1]UYZ58219.1 TonB-dependent receptor family protein [Hymenobacter sp. YIM 151858-1]
MKPTATLPHYLLGLLLCLSLLTHAQPGLAQASGSLIGTVVDQKGEAVSFANVVLLNAATTTLVTGIAADAEGHFVLPVHAPGSYVLKLSMLGYAPLQTPAFEVSSPGFSKDFSRLVLPTDAQLLQEVKVQAMRPTVVKEANKLVVNVAGSALNGGSTALDVLSRSPGVALDQDGNLQLNGKAGVQVLIDGKRSYLTGKELQNLLQSMSAENIRDLEISTSGSAKYDAAGSAGVININLKKYQQTGLSGSAYAGYQHNSLHGYSAGTDLGYRHGRWNTNVALDLARRPRYRTLDMHREFRGETGTSTFDQQGREEGTRDVPALRLGADYALSPRHTLGATLNLTHRRTNNGFVTTSLLRDGSPKNDLFIGADNREKGQGTNGTLNLHYAGQLDTAGTMLSADLDYARLHSREASTFRNRYDSLSSSRADVATLLTSQNPTDYDIYAAKLDFSQPLNKLTKLELGAKVSHVKSGSEVRFFDETSGAALLDANRSNHFIYQETVYAGYANLATSFGDKWKVQGGLRAEQTLTNGHSLTLAQTFRRNYLGLFPSVSVLQTVNADYQIGYSYNRRLDRPQYEALNPFIFYLDPYSWIQGNPYLKPQYTNSFELSQTLKQQYNLVLAYATTNGFIGEVPEQRAADKTTVFQQQNLKRFRNLSATLLVPVRVSANWQMNNTATLAYQRYTLPAGSELLRNQQVLLQAQSTHSVQLPRQVRLEMNAGYQGPMVYGLYRFQTNWWVDAGLKRAFCHDKLDVSLSATDLFRTRRLRATANLNGNVNTIDQYAGARGLRLTLRYRFRNGNQPTPRRPATQLEELGRTGQQ